jgi:hypothetical protein
MGGGLSRNMVTQKKKATFDQEKSFLAINFQLHILKRVKKLLLLKKTLNLKLQAK